MDVFALQEERRLFRRVRQEDCRGHDECEPAVVEVRRDRPRDARGARGTRGARGASGGEAVDVKDLRSGEQEGVGAEDREPELGARAKRSKIVVDLPRDRQVEGQDEGSEEPYATCHAALWWEEEQDWEEHHVHREEATPDASEALLPHPDAACPETQELQRGVAESQSCLEREEGHSQVAGCRGAVEADAEAVVAEDHDLSLIHI